MRELESNQAETRTANKQSALIKAAPPPVIATPAKEHQEKPDARIGIRGYLRMLRILISFSLFGLRAFFNSRDWRGRKREKTSEQLHEEGATLRKKFLKLGPTFIKPGQTLATRADLLPMEYI